MKFSLRFYKKAGVLLSILGMIVLSYYKKYNDELDYEVVVRCIGAVIFIVGGSMLTYAHNGSPENDNNY